MPVVASDTDDAVYTATVRASNNSTLAENVTGVLSIDTAQWITNGILNSSANDTAAVGSFGSDTPFMPGYSTNPWCFWYSSITAESYNDASLYCSSVSGGDLAYFPGSTGMSVADHADLEPGSDFRFELTGYIDTTAGANKYILHKTDALDVYVDASTTGTITCDPNNSQDASSNLVPNGAGYATDIPLEYPPSATHYTLVDDPVGTPDDASTYVESAATDDYYTDYYELQDGSYTSSYTINSVTVHYRIYKWGSNVTCNTYPILRLNSTDTVGSAHNPGLGVWTDYSETLSRPGGGSWTYADIPNLQVGVKIQGDTGTTSQIGVTQIYVAISATLPSSTVSITAVPSGEYTLLVYNNGDNILHLDLAGTGYTATVSTGGRGIPNNSNTWYIGYAAATPYVNSARMYVDHSSLEASWAWNYGATFTDLAGNGHTATPTFRTSSSDADVTLSLLDFGPVSPAQVSTEIATEWSTMITDAPDEPSTAFTEESTPGVIGANLIHSVFNYVGLPDSLFWYPFTFFTIIMGGMLVFGLFASKGQTALIIQFGVMLMLMVMWAVPGPNVYGFYVVLYFLFWSFGILVMSKSYGW